VCGRVRILCMAERHSEGKNELDTQLM
jgi:hypothetical protein